MLSFLFHHFCFFCFDLTAMISLPNFITFKHSEYLFSASEMCRIVKDLQLFSQLDKRVLQKGEESIWSGISFCETARIVFLISACGRLATEDIFAIVIIEDIVSGRREDFPVMNSCKIKGFSLERKKQKHN